MYPGSHLCEVVKPSLAPYVLAAEPFHHSRATALSIVTAGKAGQGSLCGSSGEAVLGMGLRPDAAHFQETRVRVV